MVTPTTSTEPYSSKQSSSLAVNSEQVKSKNSVVSPKSPRRILSFDAAFSSASLLYPKAETQRTINPKAETQRTIKQRRHDSIRITKEQQDTVRRVAEVAITCFFFYTRPNIFSLCFAGGSLVVPLYFKDIEKSPHFNTLIDMVESIWRGNRRWILLAVGTVSVFALPPQKWALLTCLYATYLGYKLYNMSSTHEKINTENIQRITGKPGRLWRVSTNFIHTISVLILSNSHPNLFFTGLVLGAFALTGDQVEGIATRAALIWNNNTVYFVAISTIMLLYALPSYLITSTTLYSTYMGYKLYQNSVSSPYLQTKIEDGRTETHLATGMN